MQVTCAIDTGQWFVALVGIDIEAGLLIAVLLHELQRVPSETCLAPLHTVAVVGGLGGAPAQRVIGHDDPGTVIVVHLCQPLLRVVAEALGAAPKAALFNHPAKTVIAVMFVLVGQQSVVGDLS